MACQLLYLRTVDFYQRHTLRRGGSFKERLPMNFRSTSLVLLSGAAMLFSAGCSSKNYVRQQTQPIIDKTNTLDDLTAKNNRDIRDVDTRAQQGIQGANSKAAEADQKAAAARLAGQYPC